MKPCADSTTLIFSTHFWTWCIERKRQVAMRPKEIDAMEIQKSLLACSSFTFQCSFLKAVEGTCKEGFLKGSKWVGTHLKDAEELSFLSCCKTEKTVSSFICSHSPFTASLLLLLHLCDEIGLQSFLSSNKHSALLERSFVVLFQRCKKALSVTAFSSKVSGVFCSNLLGFRVPWITTAASMDPMSCSTPKLEEFAVCD